MKRVLVLVFVFVTLFGFLSAPEKSATALEPTGFYNRDSEQCLTGKVNLLNMTTQQCNAEFYTQQYIVQVQGTSSNGNDIVTLRKNGSNLCVRTPSIADYTNVTQEECHHNWPSFQWEVVPSGIVVPNPLIPGSVELLYLVSINSNKCMTDTLGNDDVVIRPCNAWATQRWIAFP